MQRGWSEKRQSFVQFYGTEALDAANLVIPMVGFLFWLAHALILSGDVDQGERIFCRMLKHSNHVSLYSEELDPLTGGFAGNFPQGLTHIALINCALALAGAGRG